MTHEGYLLDVHTRDSVVWGATGFGGGFCSSCVSMHYDGCYRLHCAVVLLHGFKVLAIDLSRSRWHISEPVFCIVQYDNAITQYGKSFWFRLGMMKWSKYVWKSFWDHIPNKFPRMFRSDVNFVEVLERGVRGPCKVV
jgi:hypothetical protein